MEIIMFKKNCLNSVLFATSVFLILLFWNLPLQIKNQCDNCNELILEAYNSIVKTLEVKQIKCPDQEPCIQYCKNHTLIAEKNLCKNVIKLKEMTSVLNKRNIVREAIFFTETSGKGFVKPRFVCALESAAQAYIDGDVYLLVIYNQSDELSIEANEALYMVMKHFRNIQVLYVDMDKLFIGTPLEEFHKSGKLKSSTYLAPHTSDVIRFLTVWLYGGKYFDLDIITFKNLTGINNFIIDESKTPNNNIASGMFAFKKHSPIGNYIFDFFNRDFDGTIWERNGPAAITYALNLYTNTLRSIDMNEKNLKDFKKLRYEQFFPIEWFELDMYFKVDKSEAAIKRIFSIQDLIGVHIGNNIVHDEVVNVGSTQAYSLIAQQYCPRSYWSAYSVF